MFPGPCEGFFSDSFPRWRCALGVITQGIIVPLLYVVAPRHHGGSAKAWSSTSASGAFSSAEHAFFAIFALLLLSDYALFDVPALLNAHHVFTLVSHFIAIVLLPAGMPHYFA